MKDNISAVYIHTANFLEPDFSRFIKERVGAGDFHLHARDAYEFARFIRDALKHYRGGFLRLKKQEWVTIAMVKHDFSQSNPQLPIELTDHIFSDTILKQLGFTLR